MVSEQRDVERIPREPSAPLISILVAVLQASGTLQRCIDSVTGQTYPNRELIIMDGGSTDGTLEILQANTNGISYWKSEPDRGIYHAWNKALKQAQGDWICFLGADDYFFSTDVLARISPELTNAMPSVRLVYGQVALVDVRGQVLEVMGQPWARVRRRFMQESALPHQGVFHHRSLFLDTGFDESFSIAGDYELLLRTLRHEEPRFAKGVIVAGMQLGGLSTAPERRLRVLREVARARRYHHSCAFPFHWWWSFVKALVYKFLSLMIGSSRSRGLSDLYRRATGRAQIWTRY